MTAKETRVAQYHELIKKAATDLDFRQALLDDPVAVLEAEGWDLPASMEVRVVESTDELLYITLPPVTVLSDAEMDEVTGGSISLVSKVSSVSKVSLPPQ